MIVTNIGYDCDDDDCGNDYGNDFPLGKEDYVRKGFIVKTTTQPQHNSKQPENNLTLSVNYL